MGLSTKQVSGDPGLDWGQAFVPSRRQQQQAQAEALKCPRCASSNTKFCYYNNYNKSQPRHFCKSCKRHWTKGGTLRNVPVGGARKNKRPKPSKSSAAAAPPPPPPPPPAQKNMSNILYHAFIARSSPHQPTSSNSINIASSPFAAANTEQFQFSSLTTFDINPTSYHPLNAFDHFAGNLDSVEESTITTVNIPGGGAWESGAAMDLPNCWSWNDIDVLTSADLSLSWDDEDKAVIKP